MPKWTEILHHTQTVYEHDTDTCQCHRCVKMNVARDFIKKARESLKLYVSLEADMIYYMLRDKKYPVIYHWTLDDTKLLYALDKWKSRQYVLCKENSFMLKRVKADMKGLSDRQKMNVYVFELSLVYDDKLTNAGYCTAVLTCIYNEMHGAMPQDFLNFLGRMRYTPFLDDVTVSVVTCR